LVLFLLPNGTCCYRRYCRWNVKCDGLWRYCYGPWVPEERNPLVWKKRAVFAREQHMEQEQHMKQVAAADIAVDVAVVVVVVAGSPQNYFVAPISWEVEYWVE
jgi:hypothetical protein